MVGLGRKSRQFAKLLNLKILVLLALVKAAPLIATTVLAERFTWPLFDASETDH